MLAKVPLIRSASISSRWLILAFCCGASAARCATDRSVSSIGRRVGWVAVVLTRTHVRRCRDTAPDARTARCLRGGNSPGCRASGRSARSPSAATAAGCGWRRPSAGPVGSHRRREAPSATDCAVLRSCMVCSSTGCNGSGRDTHYSPDGWKADFFFPAFRPLKNKDILQPNAPTAGALPRPLPDDRIETASHGRPVRCPAHPGQPDSLN